jgi:hypothetical protein
VRVQASPRQEPRSAPVVSRGAMPGDDVEKSLDADTSTSTSSSVPEPSRPGSAPNVLVREPFTVDVESRGCSHDAMANGG